jgi:hypothetical protein
MKTDKKEEIIMKQKKELYQEAGLTGAALLAAASFVISVFGKLFNWYLLNISLGMMSVALVAYIIESFCFGIKWPKQ